MTLSDNISVVALVISLIALVMTLLQMTQSFMGTAEGYRRCAASVIDVWSNFRDRHWIWYEFRFETRFTTPQILLVSPAQFRENKEEGYEIYLLNNDRLNPNSELAITIHDKLQRSRWSRWKILRKIVGQQQTEFREPLMPDSSQLEKSMVDTNGQSSISQVRSRIGSEKALSMFRSTASDTELKEKREKQSQRQMLVSWLSLLKELHDLYYSYWPKDCAQCTQTKAQINPQIGWTDADRGLERSDHEAWRTAKNTTSTDRSDVAVIYRQWTWDFMPADTVKPLAESTIGDIVVLARRLGMQWRTLNLSENSMQADGNGFALGSTNSYNLGLVFKLSTTGQTKKFPRFVPSVAVDKLLCGILPGDPDLVKQDFDLVKPDRSLLHIEEPGSILYRSSMAGFIADGFNTRKAFEPHNEVIMLLCPFLPLENSTIVTYSLDGFLPNPGARQCTFHFWEGKYALMKALKKRIELQKDHTHHADLVAIYEIFEELETNFREDFYCRYDKAVITNHKRSAIPGQWERDDTGRSKRHLIETCRRIFNHTTTWFKQEPRNLDQEMSEGVTRYMVLVAAHMRMAGDIVLRIARENDHRNLPPQHEVETKHGLAGPPGPTTGWDYHRGVWINSLILDYVHAYAETVDEGIRHSDRGIRAFFDRRGIHFSDGSTKQEQDDHCEAMWWMLMIRGIAWDMSCWCEIAGPPVPPICYGNKTPVWIT